MSGRRPRPAIGSGAAGGRSTTRTGKPTRIIPRATNIIIEPSITTSRPVAGQAVRAGTSLTSETLRQQHDGVRDLPAAGLELHDRRRARARVARGVELVFERAEDRLGVLLGRRDGVERDVGAGARRREQDLVARPEAAAEVEPAGSER